jgi:uncharacterized protein (TIGR02001 family)
LKKIQLAMAAMIALTAVPTLSYAEGSALSFNAALSSDYRYRGISQTRLKPAVSAGVDYALSNGVYFGAWGSNINWIKDYAGDSSLELDVYAGYKGELSKGIGFDVGLLQYVYPSAKTATFDGYLKDPNTTEIYGGLTSGPFTGKLSYALTDLFGNYDFTNSRSSKGSFYLDLSASFDVGSGVMVTPHIGHQKVMNIANASYTDYSLTASKDFSGFLVSAGVVATDADKIFYAPGAPSGRTNFLGKTAVVLSVKYSF